MQKTIRNYKDTVFGMLFRDKKRLLSLYNGMNGTHYINEADLEVNTLENAVYMNMKNDVSFVFDFSLNLYEHQSTINPNMPLRNLFYVSKVLQNIVKDKNLYGSALVKIPTPRFVVFYNGTKQYPERKTEYLSNAYEKQTDEPELELAVTVVNLNSGNEELMDACRSLMEYMMLVKQIREYAKSMDIESAVRKAVADCIKEGILKDFLEENRAEVIEMSILEYDEEKALRFAREDGKVEGKIEGKIESILELLDELGSISQELENLIREERDNVILSRWHKFAARAESIEEFEGIVANTIK